jgi:hypothetical protein
LHRREASGNRAAKGKSGNVSAWLTSILFAGLAAVFSQPALAAHDGARAYKLAPDGTQAIVLFGLGTRGNTFGRYGDDFGPCRSRCEHRATDGASVARNATGMDTKMLRVGLTKIL